jgi:RHS repeat-associated protein
VNIAAQEAIPPERNTAKRSTPTDNISVETVQYTYDSLNRMIRATSGSWGSSYTYDPFGNLTAKTATLGYAPPLTQSVNQAKNQIVGATYDNNGNQIGFGYQYDAENRLISINNSYTTMRYGYDARNKRFWSWNSAWTDTMGYGNADGWQVAIYSPSGQRLETIQMNVTSGGSGSGFYLALASTLISSDTYFGGRRLAPQDRMGSVGKYYPYGEDKSTSNPAGDTWKFGTYWRDSFSSLDYADQRYYNNALGRFMTPDSYYGSAHPSNPMTWNRYSYVLGDPVNYHDPRGMDTQCTTYTHQVDGEDPTTEDWGCIETPDAGAIDIPYVGSVQTSQSIISPAVLSGIVHGSLANTMMEVLQQEQGTNCGQILQGYLASNGMPTWDSIAASLNFYDLSLPSDANTQIQFLQGAAANEYWGFSPTETLSQIASFLGQQVGAINGAVYGSNILITSFAYLGDTLWHEFWHAATDFSDVQIVQNFIDPNFAGSPGVASATFDAWLLGGCKSQ